MLILLFLQEYEPKDDNGDEGGGEGAQENQCVMKRSKISPYKYRSQGHNIIMNVHDFFAMDLKKKTTAATGVSERTVRRMKAEMKASPDGVITSPPATSRPFAVVGQVNAFDKECIRKELFASYERGKLPSLEGLSVRVKEPPDAIKESRSSVHRIGKQLHFKYRKDESDRKTLMEREDIVAVRHKYLREKKIKTVLTPDRKFI